MNTINSKPVSLEGGGCIRSQVHPFPIQQRVPPATISIHTRTQAATPQPPAQPLTAPEHTSTLHPHWTSQLDSPSLAPSQCKPPQSRPRPRHWVSQTLLWLHTAPRQGAGSFTYFSASTLCGLSWPTTWTTVLIHCHLPSGPARLQPVSSVPCILCASFVCTVFLNPLGP